MLPPSVSVRLVTSSPATASFVGRTLRPFVPRPAPPAPVAAARIRHRVVQSVRARPAGPTAPDGARHPWRWRSRWALVGALAVAMVGVGDRARRAGVALRSIGCDRRRESPRFVDETTAAGIDHSYDGEFEFFVGGGVAAFDCDDDGRAELFFAGGTRAGRAVPQREPGRRCAPLRTAGVAGHRPDGGHRCLPARHRRRRARRPRRPAPRRQRRPPRARRLPRSRTRTSCSASTAATRGRSRSARRGRARTRCRRWRSATTSRPTAQGATTAGSCGRQPTGDGYASPIALSPGYCTLSILFSDWSRSGRARPADVERPALLPRRRGAAVARSHPARRHACTPRPTDGARCRSGGWASPVRT